MKNVTLLGIVVAGDSRAEAEANYASVATGASVLALQDEEAGSIILSNANTTVKLSDPRTGADRLTAVAASELDSLQLEFLSESSEDVKCFYTVCSSGCESHLIADDESLMHHCPVCASALEKLSDEEIAKFSEPVATPAVTAQPELIAVASSFEEAVSAYRDLVERKVEAKAFDCGLGVVVANANADFKHSPYTSESCTVIEVPDFAAEASDSGDYDAHMFVCSSSACGVHVVSSADEPVFCPSCSSGLLEPDEDEEEEEDDYDLEDEEEEDDSDDSDEESDEDDEYEAEASVEEDEEDDSESDDEDDEEDDSESEEEDDEEDDMDDENALSVSSGAPEASAVQPDSTAVVPVVEPTPDATAATASQEAEAAAAPEAAAPVVEIKEVPVEQTIVQTDMLKAVASSGEELVADNLFMTLANNVNNDTKWIAIYGDTPVATASLSSTAHKDVFATKAFANLVLASAAEKGVVAALEEFGFKAIATAVAVDTYVQENIDAQVTAQVAEARANYDALQKDHAERFAAALSTAAVGINTSFFKDAVNPVKESLCSTLRSVGIQNPEVLVQTAFASGNDEYHRALIGKTVDIMSYDIEVQNQLTEAVASASSSNGIAPIGKPAPMQQKQVEPEQRQVSTSSSNPDLMSVALGSLGKRR